MMKPAHWRFRFSAGGRWLPALGLCCALAVTAGATDGTTPAAGSTSNGLPPILQNVSFRPQLNASLPPDLPFRDETGRAVRLGDYFGQDRPVILALVYYQCPLLCNQVQQGLVSDLKTLSFNMGQQFTVLSVSFDPRDTPAAASVRKEDMMSRYHRPGAADGWHFLTGEAPAIAALTQAAGFHYTWDPASQTFAHASGILVLTPEGKISRYFYGIEYPPRDLRLGLIEASARKIGGPVDQVLLFCYHYDPATGKYGAAIMNSVRLGGILTLLALGAFIGLALRRDRRAGKLRPHGAN